MNVSLSWVSILILCLALCGRSFSSEEKTWISITEHGDKPGTAFVLTEKDGKVASGKFFILDPNHPRDLSKSKCYDLNKLVHEDKTIKCKVSLIDESSEIKTKELNLTITLKGEFKESKVEAELQEGNAEKQSIYFERNNNSKLKQ